MPVLPIFSIIDNLSIFITLRNTDFSHLGTIFKSTDPDKFLFDRCVNNFWFGINLRLMKEINARD